ncbi:MAG: SPFH domain-containing protein [Holophagales bacterium]|nr:SPFH domain-containing protein [Holophagales bacterium]
MGLLDNIKQQIGSQFIEIIQWLDESDDSLVYRFPVYNQEIKMGAQLTVRENQAALFINEGKAADLFGPGRYELSTQNVPILTTLRGWKYGFQSPFKAEIYFFNTRTYTDLKWGTTNPVMMRDTDFGMIRIRAFGTYAMKVADPKVFFNTIVGTQGLTTTDEITGQLRSIILSKLSDAIAESKIPALDIAAKYDELSAFGRGSSAPSSAASASSSRSSSSRTSPSPRRSRPRSTSGRSSASSATRWGSSRRCRRPRRSRSPRRTPPAGSPAPVPASAPGWRSAASWDRRSSR